MKNIRLAENSRVVGSVQLKNSQSNGLARIVSIRINDGLQFESNGARIVARDTIAENLQWKEHNPPPTGGGNTADDKEDQCAAL